MTGVPNESSEPALANAVVGGDYRAAGAAYQLGSKRATPVSNQSCAHSTPAAGIHL